MSEQRPSPRQPSDSIDPSDSASSDPSTVSGSSGVRAATPTAAQVR